MEETKDFFYRTAQFSKEAEAWQNENPEKRASIIMAYEADKEDCEMPVKYSISLKGGPMNIGYLLYKTIIRSSVPNGLICLLRAVADDAENYIKEKAKDENEQNNLR